MELLCLVLQLLFLAVLASIISSWIPTAEGSTPDRIKRGLQAVTEPMFRPIRAVLPPVQLGAAALDLSPLVVIIAIQVLIANVCS